MPESSYKEGFFKKGDLVVYAPTNEDGHVFQCEIGVIKSVDEEKRRAYVAYDTGDTCACTRFENLMKPRNSYAVRALAERMEQLGHERLWPLADGCEDWSENA